MRLKQEVSRTILLPCFPFYIKLLKNKDFCQLLSSHVNLRDVFAQNQSSGFGMELSQIVPYRPAMFRSGFICIFRVNAVLICHADSKQSHPIICCPVAGETRRRIHLLFLQTLLVGMSKQYLPDMRLCEFISPTGSGNRRWNSELKTLNI